MTDGWGSMGQFLANQLDKADTERAEIFAGPLGGRRTQEDKKRGRVVVRRITLPGGRRRQASTSQHKRARAAEALLTLVEGSDGVDLTSSSRWGVAGSQGHRKQQHCHRTKNHMIGRADII